MSHPFGLLNRRTVRSTPNPIDKSTVVSIYPKEIVETKPTIQPGKFRIAPGSYDNPSVLVVGMSSWWREVGEEEPLLEIPISSITVADSIVKDWANGIIGANGDDAVPGIFFIPGEFTAEEIKSKHKGLLDRAKARQDNWYRKLLEIADVSWARTNGNPLGISDDMRIAAEMLGKTDRDWYRGVLNTEVATCPACGNINKVGYPVCANCKAIIDPKRAQELGLKFAM
jgi:hypothetical protein